MPIYEYQCEDCHNTFDKFVRSMSNPGSIECPECHSKNCKKLISLFGTNAGSSRSSAACAPSGGG